MKQPPDASPDPQAIRSQIDQTRHRMDETIGALGERFQGRHLVDEALHFVRQQTENGKMTHLKQQIKHSADTAVHSVIDTVKANPIPAALVGAGIAWYFYSQTHDDARDGYADGDPIRGYQGYYDAPYGGAAGGGSDVGQYVAGEPEGEGVRERLKEKAGALREKSRDAVHSAREGLHHARERAGELGSQVRERSGELYRRSRQRVAGAVDRHPLEAGIVCLAIGLIAGLALPTSSRVRSAVAPRARQLRDRSRDMVDRGKHVARTALDAAKDAAKHDAQSQGLTPKSSEPGMQAASSDTIPAQSGL